MIAWRWTDSGRGRVGTSGNGNHKFSICPEPGGGVRLSDNGKLIGTFTGVESASRCAAEIVRALSRAHSQPHSFGRNPSRFGDTFTNPTRVLRSRRGYGAD
jgi:hypothetical protein